MSVYKGVAVPYSLPNNLFSPLYFHQRLTDDRWVYWLDVSSCVSAELRGRVCCWFSQSLMSFQEARVEREAPRTFNLPHPSMNKRLALVHTHTNTYIHTHSHIYTHTDTIVAKWSHNTAHSVHLPVWSKSEHLQNTNTTVQQSNLFLLSFYTHSCNDQAACPGQIMFVLLPFTGSK